MEPIEPMEFLQGRPAEAGRVQQIGGNLSSITLTIDKVNNGYVLNLAVPSKPVKMDPLPPPVEEEQVDVVVEGLLAFFRQLRGEGEDWNGEGNKSREAIHNALREYMNARTAPPSIRYEGGRFEQKVFNDKAELLKLIDQEL